MKDNYETIYNNPNVNLEAEKSVIAILLCLSDLEGWKTPDEVSNIDERLFTLYGDVFKTLKTSGFDTPWRDLAKGQLYGFNQEEERNEIYYKYQGEVFATTKEGLLETLTRFLKDLKEKAIEREYIKLQKENEGKTAKASEKAYKEFEARKDKIRVGDEDIIKMDAINEILDRIDGKFDNQDKQYLTGYTLFDKYIQIRPWQVNVIGARTSVGKSILALNLAIQNLKHGLGVGYFSLEMWETEVLTRAISCISGVSLKALSGKLTDENLIKKVVNATTSFNEYRENRKFLFSEKSNFKEVVNEIKRRASEYGTKIFYIDYIGLLVGDRNKQKRIEIGDMVIELKHLAEELKITIFLLSQLNRQTNVNDIWERPELIHLSESGVIEQTGSIIMLLYRDFRDESQTKEELEVLIRKNRNGETKDFMLKINPAIMRISDYEETKKEEKKEEYVKPF